MDRFVNLPTRLRLFFAFTVESFVCRDITAEARAPDRRSKEIFPPRRARGSMSESVVRYSCCGVRAFVGPSIIELLYVELQDGAKIFHDRPQSFLSSVVYPLVTPGY